MERVEARNGAEAYLYNSRNAINEEKVKAALSEEDKATVEAAVVELIKEGERKGIWDFKKIEIPKIVPEKTVSTIESNVTEK